MTLPRDFPIALSQLDPDDDRERGVWHDTTLRIYPRRLAHLVPLDPWQRRNVERSYYPVRYPRLFQWILTPFYAPFGIPFAHRDLTWSHADPDHPCLEMRSCVPSDFWFAFRFSSSSAAGDAKQLVDAMFHRVHRANRLVT